MLYEEKVSPDVAAKVKEISQRLDIEPSWLMAVMHHETGGTFSPSITNKIGCVGLIQFCPDEPGGDIKTIGKEKVRLSDLKKMSAVNQLDWVYKFFVSNKSRLLSFTDVYLAVFFPAALGKPSDYVLKTDTISAAAIARQNPSLNPDNANFLTVDSVKRGMMKWIPQEYLQKQAPQEFTKKMDSVEKFAGRNWIGISLTGLLIVGVIGYILYQRKQIIKMASKVA